VNISDWIEEQVSSMMQDGRDQACGLAEDLEERQAIMDESSRPPRTDGFKSQADRAIFTTGLFQRDTKLDEAIARYADLNGTSHSPKGAEARVLGDFIEFAPSFLSSIDPPLEEIFPGLLPPGVLVTFHGDPRTMKTQAAEEMAVAGATATPPFGMECFRPKRPYRCLYSSQEDAARIVRARANGLLKGRNIAATPDNLAFAVHKGIDFDLPEWREHFFGEVVKHGFELVFIDPIRSYTAHADKGPSDVLPIAKYFRRFLVLGITICIVHHDTKPPANGPDTRRRSHRASGGGWFSVSECPVSFERIGDGVSLVSPEDYKLSSDPQPFTITYKEDSQGIRLIGESASAGEAESLAMDEKIVAHLAQNPGVSGRSITKALRKGSETVLCGLDRLYRSGVVDCVDLGRGKGKKWMLCQGALGALSTRSTTP